MTLAPPELEEPTIVEHPRLAERRALVADANDRRRTRHLIVAAVVCFIALAAVGATRSPLLDVDEVAVDGAATLDASVVRSVAGIEPGAHLVGLQMTDARNRVESLPGVAAAQVDRSWAGVVTISIDERRPAAVFETPAGPVLVAEDGVTLAAAPVGGTFAVPYEAWTPPASAVDGADWTDDMAVDVAARSRVPVVAGAMFESAPGTRVPSELQEVVVVTASLPEDLAAVVDRVELSVNRIGLRIAGGALVDLDDARNLDEKFTAVRTVLGQVELRCVDTIDVTAPMVPVVTRQVGCG